MFVQGFDAALASWMGLPTGVCVFSETCGNAVALEHNGDLYSCDHFVTTITSWATFESHISLNSWRRDGNAARDGQTGSATRLLHELRRSVRVSGNAQRIDLFALHLAKMV